MMATLEPLLSAFAARWNLDALTPDINGHYTFVFDGSFTVTVFQSGNALYLESRPGALPMSDQSDDEPLRKLLRLSLAGIERGADVLTLAEDSDTLVLFRRLPAAPVTGLRDFESALESFINRLEFWTRVLAHQPPPPVPPALRLFFP